MTILEGQVGFGAESAPETNLPLQGTYETAFCTTHFTCMRVASSCIRAPEL